MTVEERAGVLGEMEWIAVDARTDDGAPDPVVEEEIVRAARNGLATAEHPAFHAYIGASLARRGDEAGSCEAFRAANGLEPKYAVVKARLAACHEAGGDKEAALELYYQAVAIQPADASLHRQIGRLEQESGNVERAMMALGFAGQIEAQQAAILEAAERQAKWQMIGSIVGGVLGGAAGGAIAGATAPTPEVTVNNPPPAYGPNYTHRLVYGQ